MASFTLMCWNVENLFLPDADATDQGRERFQAKLTTLASVIDCQQPDLPALQEVGPNGALQALQDALATTLPHALEGEPDHRGARPQGGLAQCRVVVRHHLSAHRHQRDLAVALSGDQ